MPNIAFYVNVESRYVSNFITFQDRYFHRYMFLHFDYDYIPLLFDTSNYSNLQNLRDVSGKSQINYFVLVPFRDKNAISISSFLLSPIGEEA